MLIFLFNVFIFFPHWLYHLCNLYFIGSSTEIWNECTVAQLDIIPNKGVVTVYYQFSPWEFIFINIFTFIQQLLLNLKIYLFYYKDMNVLPPFSYRYPLHACCISWNLKLHMVVGAKQRTWVLRKSSKHDLTVKSSLQPYFCILDYIFVKIYSLRLEEGGKQQSLGVLVNTESRTWGYDYIATYSFLNPL